MVAARVSGVPPAVVRSALVGLLVLSVVPLRGHSVTYLLGGPVIAALTSVVLLPWRQWRAVRPPWLRPLVGLGTLSYAGYLWDYPLTVWLSAHWAALGRLAAFPLAVGLAALSWRYVESPLLRRARRAGSPVLVAGRV